MKTNLFKNCVAPVVFCTLIIIGSIAFAKSPVAISNHDYESIKLKMTLQLPDEWQSKVKIDETDDKVTFRYINAGGEPVFLLSISKVSEAEWMTIKDQVNGLKLLSHKDGDIIYAEKTERTKIKGANSQDFIQIVSEIDEVLKSYKEA